MRWFTWCFVMILSTSADTGDPSLCSSNEKMKYWRDSTPLPGQGNGLPPTQTQKVATVDNCMELCLANAACNAFRFDTLNKVEGQNCFMKTSAVQFFTKSGSDYPEAFGEIYGMRCSVTPVDPQTSVPDAQYPKDSETGCWKEIYSQTETMTRLASCVLGTCNLGSGENFINFDQIENLPEYHFKLVWDDGVQGSDTALEWRQSENPLSKVDADMSPYDAQLYPSGISPQVFEGLSMSSSATLLDGTSGETRWFSVGYPDTHEGGNPAYWIASDSYKIAQKTQLFVCLADGEFAVIPNHLYQEFPVFYKQWSVSLNIMPTGLADGCSNVLHVGKGGNDGEGDRTPMISLCTNEWGSEQNEVYISTYLHGKNVNYKAGQIPMNQWTRVVIRQLYLNDGSYQFTINIGNAIFKQLNAENAKEFSGVKVYTSDNYFPAAQAKIRDTTIWTLPIDVGNSLVCSSSKEMIYWKDSRPIPRQKVGISHTKVATVELCMDLCLANEACLAFSYDTLNKAEDRNCWFKNSPKQFHKHSGAYHLEAIGQIYGMRCSATPFEEPPSPPDAKYPKVDIDECATNDHTCDSNAICTNTIGSFTCACDIGYTGDGSDCTADDNKSKCPGSANGGAHVCWDYNADTGTCALNSKRCRHTLTCTKTEMIITFDKYLFGTENNSLKTAFSTTGTCLAESAPRTDGSFTWTGGFGDCGMEIATEGSFITMTKTLSIGNTDDGITLGGTKIYASGSEKTTVEFKCNYASSATATSDDISINAPVDVSASVTEANGNFALGLSLKHYTDATYKTILNDPIAIGSIVFPMITWEVNTSKLGFYIENCDVIDVTDPDVPNSADPRIPIILNTCYAGVVSARIFPDRASGIFNHKEAKFSYTSFSFTTDSADQQKISCTVQFCTTNTDGSRTCSGDDYVGAKPVVDVDNCPSTAHFNYGF